MDCAPVAPPVAPVVAPVICGAPRQGLHGWVGRMAGPWEIEPKVRRLDSAPVWPYEAARYQRPYHRRPITEMHHRDALQMHHRDAPQMQQRRTKDAPQTYQQRPIMLGHTRRRKGHPAWLDDPQFGGIDYRY